jgi:hypothetical protein
MAAVPVSGERWRLQYSHDQARSTLVINDLQFGSARRGVAVGAIRADSSGKQSPVALVTSDGGARWSRVPLDEPGVSVFYLNDTLAWLVTEKGLYQSHEGGRAWSKLPRPPQGILRVHFLDEKRGWAVGYKKGFYETKDGGTSWTPVAAGAAAPGYPDYTVYAWVAFATPEWGVISGWNLPPRAGELRRPMWVDPEAALERPELPHLNIQLETRDGGKTWQHSSASTFGRLTRLRFGPEGLTLALVEFNYTFSYPSEVYHSNWMQAGTMARVFREKDRAITDVAVTPDGACYLAGVEVPGKLRGAVPAKAKILYSRDLRAWTEMEVDYRAVARRVSLCAAGDSLWAATDNGMLLKLER